MGPVADPDAEFTSNMNELDVPPPGDGVCTVIAVIVPPVAMSAAGTWAVSWFALP